jgi:hypothetical protein
MRSGHLLTLLACAAPLALHAQSIERPPLVPDSAIAAGARDAGFADWRARLVVHGRAGASYLVEGERFELLFLTPMAVDALAPDSLIVRATRGCQRALQLSDSVVESTAGLHPWARFDSAAYARPLIAVEVLPIERNRFDCHSGLAARFAALARGAQFGIFREYEASRDVAAAEFRRGGLLEPATLSGRAPVTRVAHVRTVADGTSHVRLYIEPVAFAPGPDGRIPPLEVHAWNLVDPEPEILPVPEPVARAIWQQLLPWRARQFAAEQAAATHEGSAAVPLTLPVPSDSILRLAHARYARGEHAAAAADALDRLMTWPLPSRPDTRGAMLQAAASFTTFGEDEAMTSLLADVLEVYPCLTFSADAPASMRAAAEQLRPPARCTAHALPMIALRSLVPGGGQMTTPRRRRLGLTILGGTGAAYLLADQARHYAREAYADYRGFAGYGEPPAAALYRKAETARLVSTLFTIGAVTTWSAAAVEALIAEWRHARALAAVRDVGARPAGRDGPARASVPAREVVRAGARTPPIVAGGVVGLSVRF